MLASGVGKAGKLERPSHNHEYEEQEFNVDMHERDLDLGPNAGCPWHQSIF